MDETDEGLVTCGHEGDTEKERRKRKSVRNTDTGSLVARHPSRPLGWHQQGLWGIRACGGKNAGLRGNRGVHGGGMTSHDGQGRWLGYMARVDGQGRWSRGCNEGRGKMPARNCHGRICPSHIKEGAIYTA
eukprot:1528008-Pyramimonas_sp.AAC.1